MRTEVYNRCKYLVLNIDVTNRMSWWKFSVTIHQLWWRVLKISIISRLQSIFLYKQCLLYFWKNFNYYSVRVHLATIDEIRKKEKSGIINIWSRSIRRKLKKPYLFLRKTFFDCWMEFNWKCEKMLTHLKYNIHKCRISVCDFEEAKCTWILIWTKYWLCEFLLARNHWELITKNFIEMRSSELYTGWFTVDCTLVVYGKRWAGSFWKFYC